LWGLGQSKDFDPEAIEDFDGAGSESGGGVDDDDEVDVDDADLHDDHDGREHYEDVGVGRVRKMVARREEE
jgi:hypothetical protein